MQHSINSQPDDRGHQVEDPSGDRPPAPRPWVVRRDGIERAATIGFVGGGQMGAFNSLLAAYAGHGCHVYDHSPESLAVFPEHQQKIAALMVKRGMLGADRVAESLVRVELFSELEPALAGIDLLSESVSENLDLKRGVLARCEAICDPTVILTTNTSSFLVSELETALRRPAQFAAWHSHFGSLLMDIAPGTTTSLSTRAALVEYARGLNGTPLVHEKQRRGYLANPLYAALNSTALLLAAREQFTREAIDRAWMHFAAAPAGPFGMMDYVGLEVVRDVSMAEQTRRESNADLDDIVRYVSCFCDCKRLGWKAGEGFYRYPNPAYQAAGFLTAEEPRIEIFLMLLRRLAAAAVLLVIEGDASPEQIDLTWTTTSGAANGPFAMLKTYWREMLLDEGLLHSIHEHLQSILAKLREYF